MISQRSYYDPLRSYYRQQAMASYIARLLDQPLYINGKSPEVHYWLLGSEAADGGWPVRGPSGGITLAMQGAGALTYGVTTAPLGADDAGVTGDGTNFFKAANTTTGNVGAKDLILQLLSVPVASATKVMFGKRLNGGTSQGVCLYQNGVRYAAVLNGAATYAEIYTNNLTAGQPYLHTWAVNVDEASANGGVVFSNAAGESSYSADCSAPGDLDSASYLEALNYGSSAIPATETVHLIRVAACADWFSAGAKGKNEAEEFHLRCYNQLPLLA